MRFHRTFPSAAKEVKGTSGRTADVFEPIDQATVQAKVALASKAEVRAAAENAKAAQVEWATPIRSAARA